MAEMPKGTRGPIYAWSFSHRDSNSNPARKAERQKQMTNVIPFPPKDGVFDTSSDFTFEPEDFIDSWLPFSFSVIQHKAKDMVFVEACVPTTMAATFLQMMTAAQAASLAV